MIISFIGFLVLVDTFKSQLYDFYPDLETLMPKAKFAVENDYPARGTGNL